MNEFKIIDIYNYLLILRTLDELNRHCSSDEIFFRHGIDLLPANCFSYLRIRVTC